MTMDLDDILLECEALMEKAVDHLKHEVRGIRTGRATPALVEYIKIDYFDTPTDLRQLALITIPEPTQLVIKPYDVSTTAQIVKAIQAAGWRRRGLRSPPWQPRQWSGPWHVEQTSGSAAAEGP